MQDKIEQEIQQKLIDQCILLMNQSNEESVNGLQDDLVLFVKDVLIPEMFNKYPDFFQNKFGALTFHIDDNFGNSIFDYRQTFDLTKEDNKTGGNT